MCAVSDFTRASALAPNDAELAKALEQARTLLGSASPHRPSTAAVSGVQDSVVSVVTDGVTAETPQRAQRGSGGGGGGGRGVALPETPFSPEQELLRREVTSVRDSIKKMKADQDQLVSEVTADYDYSREY